MATNTGYTYGGRQVWEVGGRYYTLAGRYRSRDAAGRVRTRRDEAPDKVEKIGKTYGRFYRIPRDKAEELARRIKSKS